ncbi:MAG: ribonuclease P protein component [Dermatophilaceae bacterium]
MLPAPHRLRRRADFASTVRGPRSVRAGSRLLVIHAVRSTARCGPARVGFVVATSVGGAVRRNRTKRRLRALVAARLDSFPLDVDIVMRANPPAGTATFPELTAAVDRGLVTVFRRLGEVA